MGLRVQAYNQSTANFRLSAIPGAPNPFKARFTTTIKEAAPVIMTSARASSDGTGSTQPSQSRGVVTARTKGTPNVRPRATCTNVVVQTARPIVRCRSSIFLPSQTRGNVNNTPPTMTVRFMAFDSGTSGVHQKTRQINAKRVTLTRNSMICLIVSTLLWFCEAA